jgi:pilus assembly protein FimV
MMSQPMPLRLPVKERVTAQTGDALGEADIYIAYGRFNQAAELPAERDQRRTASC